MPSTWFLEALGTVGLRAQGGSRIQGWVAEVQAGPLGGVPDRRRTPGRDCRVPVQPQQDDRAAARHHDAGATLQPPHALNPERLNLPAAEHRKTLRMQESMREWLSQLQLSENSSLCQMQLYRMLRDLRDNCKTLLSNLKVTRGWRTCGQSAADVFLHGRTLLRAMQVPFDRLLSGAPLESTLPLLEALWFMRDWLPKLASIGKHALLWAGFWQAEPSGRAGKSNLAHFAELTDHQTVHPTTELGQIIADGGELSGCYGNRLTSEFAANLWSIASMFFVRGMQFSGQGSVVALVNKKMEGARPLKDSVLAQYEIPTVGNAAWTTQWGAEVILIDLQGTCSDTSPYLRQRLATGLGGLWELYQQKHFTAEEFAQLSRPSWTCIDCGADSGCELDEQLAGVVRSRLEAG